MTKKTEFVPDQVLTPAVLADLHRAWEEVYRAKDFLAREPHLLGMIRGQGEFIRAIARACGATGYPGTDDQRRRLLAWLVRRLGTCAGSGCSRPAAGPRAGLISCPPCL